MQRLATLASSVLSGIICVLIAAPLARAGSEPETWLLAASDRSTNTTQWSHEQGYWEGVCRLISQNPALARELPPTRVAPPDLLSVQGDVLDSALLTEDLRLRVANGLQRAESTSSRCGNAPRASIGQTGETRRLILLHALAPLEQGKVKAITILIHGNRIETSARYLTLDMSRPAQIPATLVLGLLAASPRDAANVSVSVRIPEKDRCGWEPREERCALLPGVASVEIAVRSSDLVDASAVRLERLELACRGATRPREGAGCGLSIALTGADATPVRRDLVSKTVAVRPRCTCEHYAARVEARISTLEEVYSWEANFAVQAPAVVTDSRSQRALTKSSLVLDQRHTWPFASIYWRPQLLTEHIQSWRVLSGQDVVSLGRHAYEEVLAIGPPNVGFSQGKVTDLIRSAIYPDLLGVDLVLGRDDLHANWLVDMIIEGASIGSRTCSELAKELGRMAIRDGLPSYGVATWQGLCNAAVERSRLMIGRIGRRVGRLALATGLENTGRYFAPDGRTADGWTLVDVPQLRLRAPSLSPGEETYEARALVSGGARSLPVEMSIHAMTAPSLRLGLGYRLLVDPGRWLTYGELALDMFNLELEIPFALDIVSLVGAISVADPVRNHPLADTIGAGERARSQRDLVALFHAGLRVNLRDVMTLFWPRSCRAGAPCYMSRRWRVGLGAGVSGPDLGSYGALTMGYEYRGIIGVSVEASLFGGSAFSIVPALTLGF